MSLRLFEEPSRMTRAHTCAVQHPPCASFVWPFSHHLCLLSRKEKRAMEAVESQQHAAQLPSTLYEPTRKPSPILKGTNNQNQG
eukprot:809104-Pelagomonas_calceolata.AAC.4